GRRRPERRLAAAARVAAAAEPQRSPWAGPASQPSQPAAPTLPVPAAPVIAAPVIAAPVVAAAAAAAAPAGKKKAADPEDNKGKFRETMWFKKGDLDAQAAVAAAEERARTGKDAAEKSDSKALEEGYNGDGRIAGGDKEKYSLRTGATQGLPAMRHGSKMSGSSTSVSEESLIGEMKGGRWKVLLAMLVVIAGLGAAVYFLFL